MANVNYTVVLDLTDNGCVQTGWRLKQGDSGNSTIIAKVVNNGVDAYDPNVTPEIAFKRADGNSVLATMTASDGYYNYTFVGNELAVAGPVVMDVTFTDEEARTSTASCRFEVVADPAGYDPEGAHTYDNPVSVLVGRATEDALIAEGFAVGQQRGQDVPSTSPYYHNNAKYYSELTDPTALRNMSDVDFNNLQNGQVPVYNSTTEKWENGNGGGGTSTLAELSDVDIALPIGGQALVYDDVNDEWINATVPSGSSTLSGLADVTITTPSNNQVLKYDATNSVWINANESGGGGDTVTWTQLVSTGTKIAEIDINGTTTDVYAPQGGGSFSALIVVAAETGQTVTATKGLEVKTATETSTGTYEIAIDSIGTWTVSDGTLSDTVAVSSQTTYYVTLAPEGATVAPTDDIQTWLYCGGIFNKSYTTLNEVLADSTTLLALISDNNAVDYLVRSTTWASGLTADSTAMTDIGANNYCANTLLADSTWLTAICNSTYFESVLNTKVPTMTSNTTPSGVASAISIFSSDFDAWKAFNGTNIGGSGSGSADCWASTAVNSFPKWIQYQFANSNVVHFVKYVTRNTSTATDVNPPKEVVIQGSNDGTNWTDLGTNTSTVATSNQTVQFTINNNNSYLYYRFLINSINQTTSEYYVCVGMLQFYGREDV